MHDVFRLRKPFRANGMRQLRGQGRHAGSSSVGALRRATAAGSCERPPRRVPGGASRSSARRRFPSPRPRPSATRHAEIPPPVPCSNPSPPTPSAGSALASRPSPLGARPVHHLRLQPIARGPLASGCEAGSARSPRDRAASPLPTCNRRQSTPGPRLDAATGSHQPGSAGHRRASPPSPTTSDRGIWVTLRPSRSGVAARPGWPWLIALLGRNPSTTSLLGPVWPWRGLGSPRVAGPLRAAELDAPMIRRRGAITGGLPGVGASRPVARTSRPVA